MSTDRLDGNVLAGPLSEVFTVDVTTASTICAGCGRQDVVADLQVYLGGPGAVARCPSCEQVVVRYASTPHGRWLDLRGAAVLHLGPAGA